MKGEVSMSRKQNCASQFDTGKRCTVCDRYHYRCSACGIDCTTGTIHGPAVTDVDKITRCAGCDRTHRTRLAAVKPQGTHEVDLLLRALVAYDDTLTKTACFDPEYADPDGDHETTRAWIARIKRSQT